MDDAGHELRTPLTIVQGHIELLDEGTPRGARADVGAVLEELSG